MRWSPGSVRVQILLEAEVVEAEAIGVEAEAVDEIAASTSLVWQSIAIRRYQAPKTSALLFLIKESILHFHY